MSRLSSILIALACIASCKGSPCLKRLCPNEASPEVQFPRLSVFEIPCETKGHDGVAEGCRAALEKWLSWIPRVVEVVPGGTSKTERLYVIQAIAGPWPRAEDLSVTISACWPIYCGRNRMEMPAQFVPIKEPGARERVLMLVPRSKP